MENETIMVALITAASGVLGALLGAAGAIIGPWWVKRAEISSEKHQLEMETRRKAIVDFSNKKIIAIQAYHQVFSLGGRDDALSEKIQNSNLSTNELYSLIGKEDSVLKDWINKMTHKAFFTGSSSINDVSKAQAFLGIGIQYIIAWHSGELKASELKPFGLNSRFEPVWLDSWDSEWPC